MLDAIRRLAQRPMQTLLALLVLGAGLGTVTFCLTLVNGLVLRPLPFENADRLYAIGYEQKDDVGISTMLGEDFVRLRPALQGLDRVAAYGVDIAYVRQGDSVRRHATTVVTHDLLPALGVVPVAGRGFEPADDQPNAAPVALIGHRAWQRDYAGADVIGRAIEVNGVATTIVGVLPSSFEFPYESTLLLPARLEASSQRDVAVVVLSPRGASTDRIRSIVTAAASSVGTSLDGVRAGRVLTAKPVGYLFVDEGVRVYVVIMLVASLLVLVIACANTANLQLMQAIGRQQEMAIRSALGAQRSELIRDVLLESLLLALGAAAIALVVAQVAGSWLMQIFADSGVPPPYFLDLGVDLQLLAMAVAIAVTATGLAGLWPAVKATRLDIAPLLHDGNKGSSGSWSRTAGSLVVLEVALTAVLLAAAAASLMGLGGLGRMDVGTTTPPERLLVGTMELHASQFPDNASRSRFLDRVVTALKGNSQILNASASTTLPGALLGSHEFIGAQGAARQDDGFPRAQTGAVDEDFLSTYGIRLREGRDMTRFVDSGQLDVALVDTTTAALLWPGKSAIGQTMLLNPDRPQPDAVTVVGVIERLQLDSVMAARLPTVLVPIQRYPRSTAALTVRTRDDPAQFAASLSQAIRAENGHVILDDITTHAEAIDRARLGAVVLSRTFAILGVVALILAMGGLYAILSLSVSRRMREVGIARALGARDADVARMVLGRIGMQVAGGLLLGGLLAVPFSRMLAEPGTPIGVSLATVAAVALVVAVVGIASALPALKRALRIDPLAAIQQE